MVELGRESYFEYPYRINSENFVRALDTGQLMGDTGQLMGDAIAAP